MGPLPPGDSSKNRSPFQFRNARIAWIYLICWSSSGDAAGWCVGGLVDVGDVDHWIASCSEASGCGGRGWTTNGMGYKKEDLVRLFLWGIIVLDLVSAALVLSCGFVDACGLNLVGVDYSDELLFYMIASSQPIP